jgi:hypothetical protein
MSLTANRALRWGGAAGIVFVVLGVVSLFLPGTPPKADEVAKITTYLTDKRGSILAGNYLAGIAFAFFLVFAGALRSHFGAADTSGFRPGAVALAGAVAATAMVLAGGAVINGAVFQVAKAGDANLNHALYDVANDLFISTGFGLAAFFQGSAVAIALTGALPRILAPAASLLAVLNLVGGVALFAKSGFFAIGGAFGIIVPLLSLIWVVAASVVMLRGAQRPAARAEPAV